MQVVAGNVDGLVDKFQQVQLVGVDVRCKDIVVVLVEQADLAYGGPWLLPVYGGDQLGRESVVQAAVRRGLSPTLIV